MKVFVISGGPGTGKTSVINELGKEFQILSESAREIGEKDPKFQGKSIKETNQQEFQDALFEFDKKQIDKINKKGGDKIVFADRGLGDTIAYCKVRNLKKPFWVGDYVRKFRYAGIFILDFLDNYVRDTLRQESKEEQEKIHEEIIKTYEDLGYKIIFVPFMSIKDRVSFIKSNLLAF